MDLLFASSGIERDIVREAETLEIPPDVSVPVASLPHLLALKVLSHDADTRPQDGTDLLARLRVGTAEALAETERALALITTRGCRRDRDLSRLFAEWRARAAAGRR